MQSIYSPKVSHSQKQSWTQKADPSGTHGSTFFPEFQVPCLRSSQVLLKKATLGHNRLRREKNAPPPDRNPKCTL